MMADDQPDIQPTTRGAAMPTTRGAAPRSSIAMQYRSSTYITGERIEMPDGGAFVVEEFIQEGAEGEVYRVVADGDDPPLRAPANTSLALKLYRHTVVPNAAVTEVWSSMKNGGVLALYDHGRLRNGRPYEVIEFAHGGSLAKALPIRDLDLLRDVLVNVIDGLQGLHQVGIIHRDIKPDNLLCREAGGRGVALADFGVATILQDRSIVLTRAAFGTADFMAPEQTLEIRVDGELKNVLGPPVDYYALGITLLVCWTGHSPFGAGVKHLMGEIASLKQRGEVPIADDLPEPWRRLIRALLAVVPSQRLDYEGVQRWLRGEHINVPETRAGIAYPPISFRTDRGADVTVTSPEQLAALLEQNPTVGRTFVYGRYVERAGWDKANLGLCAALTTVIEETYPRDHDAGLAAAVYVLDPARPFQAGTTAIETYSALADHLAREAATYQSQLKNASHKLWIYLGARPDQNVRERVTAFVADFNDAALAPTALFRLILWLRALDGDQSLLFHGVQLTTPNDILTLENDALSDAVRALQTEASLLSVWTVTREPSLADTLARWRKAPVRDSSTVAYALGRGFLVGDDEIRLPLDAFTGRAETMTALWEGRADRREQLDAYLVTFHGESLVGAAYAWLQGAPAGAHMGAVVEYVTQRVDTLVDLLLPSTAVTAPSIATTEALDRAMANPGPATAALWSYMDTVSEQDPWRVMTSRITPALLRMIARARMDEAAEGRALDGIARSWGTQLARPTVVVPLGLHRLALALRAVCASVEETQTSSEAVLWQKVALRMNGAIEQAYKSGYAELGSSLTHLTTAEALMRDIVTELRACVQLPFFNRFDEEERVYASHATTIQSRIASERGSALQSVSDREKAEIASMQKTGATSGAFAAEIGNKKAAVIAFGGTIAITLCYLWSYAIRPKFDMPGLSLPILIAAIIGGVIAHKRFGARFGKLAAVGGALVAAGLLNFFTHILVIGLVFFAALIYWRWYALGKATKKLETAKATIALNPSVRRVFADAREQAQSQFGNREAAWRLATRGALAVAPTPADVSIDQVRAQLANA
jgi:hypothetical protein